MPQIPSEQEMIRDITRMGVRTAVLLRGVMLQKVDRETLKWGLDELAAGDLINRYFPLLIQRKQWVHLLNLLHLVYSLQGQVDFQIQEYGLDSFKDDLEEINNSLQHVGEQFNLEKLREPL